MLKAKNLIEEVHLAEAGVYDLLNTDNYSALKIDDKKSVMKQALMLRLKKHTKTC